MDQIFPQKRKTDEDQSQQNIIKDNNSPIKELKSNKNLDSSTQPIINNKNKKKTNNKKKIQPTLEFFGVKSNIEDTSQKTYPKFPTNDKNKTIKMGIITNVSKRTFFGYTVATWILQWIIICYSILGAILEPWYTSFIDKPGDKTTKICCTL